MEDFKIYHLIDKRGETADIFCITGNEPEVQVPRILEKYSQNFSLMLCVRNSDDQTKTILSRFAKLKKKHPERYALFKLHTVQDQTVIFGMFRESFILTTMFFNDMGIIEQLNTDWHILKMKAAYRDCIDLLYGHSKNSFEIEETELETTTNYIINSMLVDSDSAQAPSDV